MADKISHEPRASGNPFRDDIHAAETGDHPEHVLPPHQIGDAQDHAIGGNDVAHVGNIGENTGKGRPPLMEK